MRWLAAASTAALLSITLTTGAQARESDPWGKPQALYTGRASIAVAQATSNRGMTVAVFRATPRSGFEMRVAVQLAGHPWGEAARLSEGAVLNPKVLAWGAGNVSVIWESRAGQDNYLFHVKTVDRSGRMSDAQTLTKATYAYSPYQAAINHEGRIALAWSGGDLHDRVVVQDGKGGWSRLPPVPVVHPLYHGLQFVSNPRDLFLDDSGQVSLVTWGSLNGSSRIVYLMHMKDNDTWGAQRVAPMRGSNLGYGWVDHVHAVADPRGDVAFVLSQRNNGSGQWSTVFRYRSAGGALGKPTLLSHYPCFIDGKSCGDLAMAKDGSTLVAWPSGVGHHNIVVNVMRRDATGTFSAPQKVSTPIWENAYDFNTVEVAANGQGDALVSFDGGDEKNGNTQWVRCPAGQECAATLILGDHPSWLDSWVTSVGPQGGSTVTWVRYYRTNVVSRHLDPVDG